MAEKPVIEQAMVDLEPDRQRVETKPAVPAKTAAPAQRVFRVTTLKGGDYESIPLHRLQNSFGSKGFGRGAIGSLGLLVVLSAASFMIYMHALQKLHIAQQRKYISDAIDFRRP